MTDSSGRDETSGYAISALVFAVLGWTVMPFLGQVLAAVYAARARRELERDPSLRGRGLAAAARSLSFVFVALLLFAAVVVFAVAIVVSRRNGS